MTDPVVGLGEMARVTRPGGVVAACVWDYGGGRGPLSTFWRAAKDLDPDALDESGLAGARTGHLTELFHMAGLRGLESTELTVRVAYVGFDAWWEPYTLGVGPAGAYVSGLEAADRGRLRTRCEALMLPAPFEFEVSATAWAVRGRPTRASHA
jgi:hypothetical protein